MFCIAIGVLLAAGCNSAKHLSPQETFLESNSVKLQTDEKIKNKGSLKTNLENLYRQKETRVVVGIPRHTFYYAGQNNPDSTWFKRWLSNKVGDPPVIFDTIAAERTVDAMTRYLRQRGYWNAEVEYTVRADGHRSSVRYIADPRKRWTIDSISYVSQDSVVQHILDSIATLSPLQPGSPVDFEIYEQDRLRITRTMQNLGYAEFFKNYISQPLADSSDLTMDLEIDVLDPPEGRKHLTFDIGEIRIYPDYASEDPIVVDTMIDGVRFRSPQYPFLVKPEVLLRSIYFETGDRYRFDDIDKTRKQLNKLGTYRFVTVQPSVNPFDSTLLDYDITLTRNKTMGIGGDIELNYSTLSAARRTLLGVGFDVSYRHRNLFKGGEYFSSALETGIEFNFKSDTLINSFNINFQNTFLIPRFIDPIKFYTGLNRIRLGNNGLFGDKVYNWIKDDFSSVNVGYQYLSLVDLYSYHTANVSIGYDAQPDPYRRLQLNHFGVDFFSPNTRPQFEEILDSNRYLQESFTPQFFTGVLFKDYRFIYSGNPNITGGAPTVIQTAEISGLEVLGINSLVNWLGNHEGALGIGNNDTLKFAQFIKLDLDFRYHKLLKGNQELAFRAAAGIAFPYGPFSKRVPYVKQFYIGGPQSIRAWQIRELGPGSYQDPFVPANAIQFYQTGDIRFEIAAEYRFKIGWIFNGAFFLEAGNVWTLTEDKDRPGASFSTSFLNEFAVGTGTGLRLDFDYFVIRWDLGYKLRNPYADENGNYWLWDNVKNFSFSQFNSNFAIGYPF